MPEITLDDFIKGFVPSGGVTLPNSPSTVKGLPMSKTYGSVERPPAGAIPGRAPASTAPATAPRWGVDQNGIGSASLPISWRTDPTAGILNADPIEMALGIPLYSDEEDFGKLTQTALSNVAQMGTPPYLQEDYAGPQTGHPVTDALAGLGSVLQAGSGTGNLAGPTALAAQALGPEATNAMGISGSLRARVKPTAGLMKFMDEGGLKLDRNDMSPEALGKVQKMWQATGWDMPHPDSKPRFEIPDNAAKLRWWQDILSMDEQPGVSRAEPTLGAPLRDWLEHPELYVQYPHVADIPVNIKKVAGKLDTTGSYWRGGQEKPNITIDINKNSSPKDILSTLLHETQHGVQDFEGLFLPPGTDKIDQGSSQFIAARLRNAGMSPEDASSQAYLIYHALKNETEARNTQYRFENPEQNRIGNFTVAPSLTTDYVPKNQISSYSADDPRRGIPLNALFTPAKKIAEPPSSWTSVGTSTPGSPPPRPTKTASPRGWEEFADQAEGKPPRVPGIIGYRIVNKETGQPVSGDYGADATQWKRARSRRDKLDNEYGSYRYRIDPIYEKKE